MEKTDHKLTIFFGDTQEYLSCLAKEHNSLAVLVDHSNYKQIVKNSLGDLPSTVYTSLGDLPKDLNIVYNLLLHANQIYYCPPEQWSDKKIADIAFPGESVQGLTEILLSLLPDTITVQNICCSLPDPDPLVDVRKTNQPQLWVAGCSISHGIGVDNNQRYGQLLADDLNLCCSFLTRPGSAINWAADQILRSDIREDDIVIFGITNPTRITYIHDNQLLEGINVTTYENFPEYHSIVNPTNLFSHQTLYTHYYSIQKVINFCKQTKSKLFLVGLLLGEYSFITFLKSQKNYVHISYPTEFTETYIKPSFIDVGSDSKHPGPKQHQQYKKLILEHIKSLHQDTV